MGAGIWAKRSVVFKVVTTFALLPGCEVPQGTVQEGSSRFTFRVGSLNQGPLVCDPFGGSTSNRNQGLEAKLYSGGALRPSKATDYPQLGWPLDARILFTQLQVPTRPFDRGFQTTEGQTLKDANGQTLYEWFGLHLRTDLTLPTNLHADHYQLALLSDDGSLLKAELEGQQTILIDNDQTHPTRLKVANRPVALSQNARIPLELHYFQGPRYHIALTLLWRPWREEGAEPLNGASGNDLWFDSTKNPPEPQSSYRQLLSRGWEPVPSAAFLLPNGAAANPCPENPLEGPDNGSQTAELAVLGFDGSAATTAMDLIWQSQGNPTEGRIRWGEGPTLLGQSATVAVGPGGVFQTSVQGLRPDTDYFFQAEIKNANGNTATSDVIRKRTKIGP
jgi:hypothetical protein